MFRELPVPREQPVRPARQAFKVHKVHKVRLGLMAQRVRRGLPVLQVPRAQLAHKAFKVQPA